MSSKPYTETVHEGHRPLQPSYGATTIGLHADPLEGPGQQVTDEKSEYLDELETGFSGVEQDFHKAISDQVGQQRTMGRAAVLRMSHPYSKDGGAQEDLARRRIQWQKLRDPAEHSQSSTPAASDSGLAESPEGLLFQDLGAFREALKVLPRGYDESTVPQFFDKQLIVLEDLGRDWVETIGKAFHVPPRVFALHWASPSFYQRGKARVPLGQPAEEHFVLPYLEMLPLKLREGEPLVKLDCCSVRFVGSNMQQDEGVDQGSKQKSDATNALCEAMISYWGRLGEQKEWTAILLVDPHPASTLSGGKDTYKIVPADEDGKTLDNLAFKTSRIRRAPLPDPRPALRGLHDESNWRPLILDVALDGPSESMVWTPICWNILDVQVHY